MWSRLAASRRFFSPKSDNWRRLAKVPILVLNATSLNTGHNWQFTASWQGEPPAGIDAAIDANYRLRRMYHQDAPEGHKKIRLGEAVAASSCVPGLFEPYPLAKLYPNKTVRLVDGGVYDNQGMTALLDQDCSVLIVSDASGQMDTVDDPGTGLLGVPLRANSILQARVRRAQFRELAARRRSGLLRGLVFLHLKKDLDVDKIDWLYCQNPTPAPHRKRLTGYGIQKQVQRRLAAIRTDLDSFSDTEAFALMTSGYRMAEQALTEAALGFDFGVRATGAWHFLIAEPGMKDGNPRSRLMRRLQVAEKIAFKIWRLSRVLQIGGSVLILMAVALSISIVDWWRLFAVQRAMLTLGWLTAVVALVVVAGLLSMPILRLLKFPKTLQQLVIGIGMASFGFVVARLHLHVFDKLFLWDGRLSRRRP